MGSPCPCHNCPAREIGIFSSLNEEELMMIKDLPHQNFYKKHHIILHEDNPCQGFYVLRTGRAKLIKSSRTGRQQILKIVNPAGIIGEDAVFRNGPYAFTAETIEDSEACFINKDDFSRLLKEKTEIALKVLSILSGDLREARTQMIDMALKDARERMAGLILTLAERYGREKERGCIILGLSLTRCEMAEMIGVSQETAIRLLSQFKDNGLISLDHRQITVLNKDKMRMIAYGEQASLEKVI